MTYTLPFCFILELGLETLNYFEEQAGKDDASARITSKPVFYTSPIHLRAAAYLYGVETVPVEKARVLELGCGAGANLLPFALGYPNAHAVGVDLWPDRIRQGQKLIQDLGIKNLDLHALLFTDINRCFGEFDYIIVHDVFTWAPSSMREAILRICRENLSPLGIAYISYNTYPGWRAGDILRDALHLHGHSADSMEEMLTSASAMLNLMSDGLADKNPNAVSLKTTVDKFRQNPDYYINSEYLQATNSACYFVEFADAALQAGLAYAGDAEPQDELSVVHGLNVQLHHGLLALGQPKVMRQQYLDFAVGRQFRKSIFIAQDRAEGILVSPDLTRLSDLRWAAGARRIHFGTTGEAVTYATPSGGEFMLTDKLEIAVVEELSHAWPRSLTFDNLLVSTRFSIATIDKEADHEKAVRRSLESLFKKSLLRYSLDVSPYDVANNNNLCLISGLAYISAKPSLGVIAANFWHDIFRFKLDAVETVALSAFEGKASFTKIQAIFSDVLPSNLTLDERDTRARHSVTHLVDLLRRQGALLGSISAWVAYFQMALRVNSMQEYYGLSYLGPLLLYASSVKQRGVRHEEGELVGSPGSTARAVGRRNFAPDVLHQISRLKLKKKFLEAETLTRQLVTRYPDHAPAWHVHGQVLCSMGRAREGFIAFLKAIAMQPLEPSYLLDLSGVLLSFKLRDEAESCIRKALRINPHSAIAWNNMGNALRVQKKWKAAEDCYRRAISEKGDFGTAYNNLAGVCMDLLHVEEAANSYHKALELEPNNLEIYSNWLFASSHDINIDPLELFQRHRTFGLKVERRASGYPKIIHVNSRDVQRKLRIGFVSGDLRSHAVANFLEPVWRALIATAFQIYAYSSSPIVEDEVSMRLRTYTSKWSTVLDMNDAALAECIREDGIDILFDLSGHTGYNRLPMFALKPAPVQISWIGYPGTTGLQAMDYRIVSKHIAPLGLLDSQFTERLVYLPTVTAFQPFSPSPDISILPSLSADHFTFGSFNRPNKFSDAVFSVWAKVLGAVPKSRMLLGNMIGDSMAKDVIARFAALGIDRSRLVLHERSSLPEYLRLHHQVDLLLDTFPYGGGTTTNHGLWMGIPTLTLAGDTFASRVGASLMYQQGLTEFIAYSQQDYLDKAVDWSSRRVELADIRQNMRKHLENLPERSEEFFAKTLEAMLRTMWKRYCTGKLPESFEVEV